MMSYLRNTKPIADIENLREEYIQGILDGADWDTLYALAQQALEEGVPQAFDGAALLEEIRLRAPHLLDDDKNV